jgi:hypothetical protein
VPTDLWSLPGPNRWLTTLTDDRRDGRSGVVVMPGPDDPPLIADELCNRRPSRFGHERVEGDTPAVREAHCHGGDVALAGALAAALDLDMSHGPWLPETMASKPDLFQMAVLVDARPASRALQEGWARFAAAFAAGGTEVPPAIRPTVWVLQTPAEGVDLELPARDVSFTHRWWWGALGPIDSLLAARERHPGDLAPAVAELVRWDLGLLEALDGWDGDVDAIPPIVTAPPNKGVTAPAERQVRDRPPAALLSAWCDRLVESWDGQLDIHVRAEELARPGAALTRVWLGQVARFMPLIEVQRARLAEWLDREVTRIGVHRNWTDEDITTLEIGPLKRCLDQHRQARVRRERIDLIVALKDARNALAHRRPLGANEITRLRNLIENDRS